MATLTLVLLALLGLGVEFGPLQAGAAVVNLVGWLILPFAPRLYRRVLGHDFSWRSNGALGGQI